MRIVALRPFVRTLLRMGVDAAASLRRCGLPVDVESDGNRLVSSIAVFNFLDEAGRRGAVAGFGLEAGSRLQPEDLGLYGRLLLHSHTGAEMLVRAPYLVRALHSGQLIWAESSGDRLRICFDFVDGLKRGRREVEYFVLMSAVNTLRIFGGDDWRPTEVQLRSGADPRLSEHEALAGARIRSRQPHTSILIPRGLLLRPVPSVRRAPPAYQAQLEAMFLATAPVLRDSSAVRETVRELLLQGAPAIEQTAEALAVSPRTLQRRLAADALTYSRLLDQVRFERARELLADAKVPLIEAAMELGYTDQSNFSRAFRRWVGLSPGAYRQALLREAETAAPVAPTLDPPRAFAG